MPIFRLTDELVFPPTSLASEDGILAIGGDLSLKRMLLAYQQGIFPWYSEEQPILWWCPDPRFVLYPENLKISKSLKQVIRNKGFKTSYNTCFEARCIGCVLYWGG